MSSLEGLHRALPQIPRIILHGDFPEIWLSRMHTHLRRIAAGGKDPLSLLIIPVAVKHHTPKVRVFCDDESCVLLCAPLCLLHLPGKGQIRQVNAERIPLIAGLHSRDFHFYTSCRVFLRHPSEKCPKGLATVSPSASWQNLTTPPETRSSSARPHPGPHPPCCFGCPRHSRGSAVPALPPGCTVSSPHTGPPAKVS